MDEIESLESPQLFVFQSIEASMSDIDELITSLIQMFDMEDYYLASQRLHAHAGHCYTLGVWICVYDLEDVTRMLQEYGFFDTTKKVLEKNPELATYY